VGHAKSFFSKEVQTEVVFTQAEEDAFVKVPHHVAHFWEIWLGKLGARSVHSQIHRNISN
jgi:3-deoxy-D-arabino-heptulosonate 7-phosphate (DAHP) synthase